MVHPIPVSCEVMCGCEMEKGKERESLMSELWEAKGLKSFFFSTFDVGHTT